MSHIPVAGSPIRERDELLCLTDMWKAAGSPEDKRPSDWLSLPGPSEFVQFVADGFNTGLSGIIVTERGRTGGTWAHWQIGMAYAKYLSSEFHAWCNEVIRAHMDASQSRERNLWWGVLGTQTYRCSDDQSYAIFHDEASGYRRKNFGNEFAFRGSGTATFLVQYFGRHTGEPLWLRL